MPLTGQDLHEKFKAATEKNEQKLAQAVADNMNVRLLSFARSLEQNIEDKKNEIIRLSARGETGDLADALDISTSINNLLLNATYDHALCNSYINPVSIPGMATKMSLLEIAIKSTPGYAAVHAACEKQSSYVELVMLPQGLTLTVDLYRDYAQSPDEDFMTWNRNKHLKNKTSSSPTV